jgi:hypothetical protein
VDWSPEKDAGEGLWKSSGNESMKTEPGWGHSNFLGYEFSDFFPLALLRNFSMEMMRTHT